MLLNFPTIYNVLSLDPFEFRGKKKSWVIIIFASFFLIYFCVCLFKAAPVAYGSSQARGWIRATAASLYHSPKMDPSGIRAMSVTYNTAHGNARSLTHWAKPGMEPESSGILVSFFTTEPWRELPSFWFLCLIPFSCLTELANASNTMLSNSDDKEYPVGVPAVVQWVKDPVTAVAKVTVAAQIGSLAWEPLYASCEAEKEKTKQKPLYCS